MKKCLRLKCQKEFEPNKPKQVFCSDKCRVYFSREKKKGTESLPKVGDDLLNGKVTKAKQHNHKYTVAVTPNKVNLYPDRLEGESMIDYKIRTGR